MKFILALMALVAAQDSDEEVTYSDEETSQAAAVAALKAGLGYDDWTFTTFEALEANIDEWADKITVYDLYESDFYSVGSADSVTDVLDDKGVETIYVEPCEMFVMQVTLPWDFADNWMVDNEFEINDFGFVDAFDINSDSEEERYRGAYAVRFPCDDYPGQTYKQDEYGKYSLTLMQDYRASDSAAYWRRTIAFEFEVADKDYGEDDAIFWIVAILMIVGAVFVFT